MIIFGVDVPLVEVLLVLGIMVVFILIEAIILLTLLLKAINKVKGK
ncbi:hypothetical protein J4421_01755 [Candidatus Woesearchaeota archaeon]|nr:hypothetical protein [Candidatus Woesearchaeota archaeon]